MTKYPNLSELLQYYPCGTGTVCDHAEIEPELSYCHYLGVKECFRNYVSWSTPAPKRRGPGRRAVG